MVLTIGMVSGCGYDLLSYPGSFTYHLVHVRLISIIVQKFVHNSAITLLKVEAF